MNGEPGNTPTSQPPDSLPAQVGARLQVELLYEGGERETLSLQIVPDNAADFPSGLLGESTPLAQSLLGHFPGEMLDYQAGDILHARLLSVSPGPSRPAQDLTARRQETIRKAVQASDRTNAIIFASSMNSKWGDYDPGGLEEWDDER